MPMNRSICISFEEKFSENALDDNDSANDFTVVFPTKPFFVQSGRGSETIQSTPPTPPS